MTETKRLYYEDVYKKEFTAKVLECREAKKAFISFWMRVLFTRRRRTTKRYRISQRCEVKEVHERRENFSIIQISRWKPEQKYRDALTGQEDLI